MVTFLRRGLLQRNLQKLFDAVEKNLEEVNCRTRAQFEEGLKKPDGGGFVVMAAAIYKTNGAMVEDYFDNYFDQLTPDIQRRVAHFFCHEFL
jgi:hypothetical protein